MSEDIKIINEKVDKILDILNTMYPQYKEKKKELEMKKKEEEFYRYLIETDILFTDSFKWIFIGKKLYLKRFIFNYFMQNQHREGYYEKYINLFNNILDKIDKKDINNISLEELNIYVSDKDIEKYYFKEYKNDITIK